MSEYTDQRFPTLEAQVRALTSRVASLEERLRAAEPPKMTYDPRQGWSGALSTPTYVSHMYGVHG